MLGFGRAARAHATPIDEDDDAVLELSELAPDADRNDDYLSMTSSVRTPAAEPAIVSERAAEASRGPLEALSRMVVKPETPGADTLEGMVREMLRPMLRDWLDANLPELVETMVAREIKRITGRAG